ncbi:MAG: nuclear transport factor 2 family protein [Candidatus Bathyarchaeota archaeon]|nr:MAG: nuclear transport factor 2 family protein [Candidatus Bathyarchaeota archaeon]
MKTVDIEAEKKEILRHIEELEAAENRKDIEGILKLVAEDFVFMYRNSKIEGKEDTREMLKESVKNFISSKHVPLRVEVSSSGDMAWYLGYEINERERDEGIVETKQNALATFRKVESKWKQVAVCIA